MIKKKFKIIEDISNNNQNNNNEDNNNQDNNNENNNIKSNNLIQKYLNSLDEFEKQAINIAKKSLETSFDIEKCIGFIKFKKTYNEN
jgi:hypothetical protein